MSLTPFVETRLELGIPFGISGGPYFSTLVSVDHVGNEVRLPRWEIEIGHWDIGSRRVLGPEYRLLKRFHRARRGRAVGFRLKIWGDYLLSDEPIGTGDGATLAFALIQTADDGYGDPYVRRIRKPIGGTETVKLDGVVQNPAAYTLDTTSGSVTFDTAPGNGVVVAVSIEYDTPVRFDSDGFPHELVGYRAHSGEIAFELPPIPVVELLNP